MAQRMRERHQLLVTLHQTPDISPWGLVGTAMDIEQTMSIEKAGKTNQPTHRTGRVNAVKDSPSRKERTSKNLRASKRFQDLEERDQQLVLALQQDLKEFELKAKLPPELLQRSRELSVCGSCHRYGHNEKGCKARAIFVPKN